MSAVIEVLLSTATFEAAVPPSVTVAPATNPVPVIVIDVPPAVGPDGGETPLTVGAVGVGEGVGVGVGDGEDTPPHGSTVPAATQSPAHRHQLVPFKT